MIAAAAPAARPAVYPHPATDPPALAFILDYVARYGWEVFPCHSVKRNGAGAWVCTCNAGASCSSPGKHPLTARGLAEASSDPATIRAWAARWPRANWARRPGPNEFVVDIDVKSDKDGRPWLAAHRELIPPTLTARRGDGLHFHLQAPAGTPIKNVAGEIAPGVDVRSHAGYIMLPPSRHISGDLYEWVPSAGPDATAPALAPWALLLLVAKLPKPDPPGPAVQVGSPQAPRSEEAPADREWLLRKYTAAASGRRHLAGLDLACQLRDNRFSEWEAESIMREYHSAVAHKGGHPYTWDDALRTLRSVYKTPARQPINRQAPRGSAVQDRSPVTAPVDPDTGEIAGPIDAQLVQDLAIQIAAATARADRAEAALEQSRQLWERARRLMSMPNITNANILRTAFFMLPVLDYETRQAGSPTARVRAKMNEIATLSNQDPVKVGRDIKKMHEMGWLEREEVKELPDPLPGQASTAPPPITVETKTGPRTLPLGAPRPKVTHIYVTPTPGFLEVDTAVLAPPTKGEWGSPKGRRPKRCEACGSLRMQAITYRCVDCGHEQPADLETEPAIQDGCPVEATPAPVDGCTTHNTVDPHSGMDLQDVHPVAAQRTTAPPAGKTPPAGACSKCGCTEWRWWDTGGWLLACRDTDGRCQGRAAA